MLGKKGKTWASGIHLANTSEGTLSAKHLQDRKKLKKRPFHLGNSATSQDKQVKGGWKY